MPKKAHAMWGEFSDGATALQKKCRHCAGTVSSNSATRLVDHILNKCPKISDQAKRPSTTRRRKQRQKRRRRSGTLLCSERCRAREHCRQCHVPRTIRVMMRGRSALWQTDCRLPLQKTRCSVASVNTCAWGTLLAGRNCRRSCWKSCTRQRSRRKLCVSSRRATAGGHARATHRSFGAGVGCFTCTSLLLSCRLERRFRFVLSFCGLRAIRHKKSSTPSTEYAPVLRMRSLHASVWCLTQAALVFRAVAALRHSLVFPQCGVSHTKSTGWCLTQSGSTWILLVSNIRAPSPGVRRLVAHFSNTERLQRKFDEYVRARMGAGTKVTIPRSPMVKRVSAVRLRREVPGASTPDAQRPRRC
eukprot:Rhum_TRINITY_DN14766_c9_g1::Rhum_TRINITY_DN14766_c9_g1_i4::g.115072::m.115072